MFGKSQFSGRSLRLEFVFAREIPPEDPKTSWLIEGIWADQGVGIIGGPPKAMKTWLTADAAVSVASGTPLLGTYEVKESGAVLLISMEGTLGLLRHRLDGIAQARGLDVASLPVKILKTSQLYIDAPIGFAALEDAVRADKPKLLVIDPFVRVFRGDEDDAGSVSKVLGLLRKLQRDCGTAIMLVHHAKKGSTTTTGQSLRGSGDLHAWGDSNLYVSKKARGSHVTIEQRATESGEGFLFTVRDGAPVIIEAGGDDLTDEDERPKEALADQIVALLRDGPLGLSEIQDEVKVKRLTVSNTLRGLEQQGVAEQVSRKWQLKAGE